ncbi:hypothetical protein LINPERPRIM_LOCUS15759 [Linum perenne]
MRRYHRSRLRRRPPFHHHPTLLLQPSVLKTSSESGLLSTTVPSSTDIHASVLVSDHNIGENPTGVHASVSSSVIIPTKLLDVSSLHKRTFVVK